MSAEELTPRQLRLLLVEDNADDAFLLERHLARGGFLLNLIRVETASEMADALAASTKPDLIIADYHLPNFSGPAALQLLKATRLDIPFIMMSGAISEETAVDSMRAGAQDYVTKQRLVRLIPVIERELRDAMARRSRLAAEVALEESETRFRRLVEAMPLGLLISDAEGRIIYANSAAQKLLGYSKGLVDSGQVTIHTLGSSLLLAYTEPGSTLAMPMKPFETTCTGANGQPIEVLIGVAVLNPDVDVKKRQLAAFVADLTLQKKSEEVLRRTEKLAVAGRFAAAIAHEINNPLEAVVNCLYLLSGTPLTDDARAYLSLAQDELNRVAQITVQTLRFYRRSTHAGATQVNDLIETVLALLTSRLNRQQITVVRQLGDLPPIFAHDGELRQVLANLIGNAMDALANGGTITLKTSVSSHWTTGEKGVRISVADDGTGMDAATLSRIFEPFFSTKGITGTGLGLWISREIIERHRGSLVARSRKREGGLPGGTVFSLFVPLQATEPGAGPGPDSSLDAATEPVFSL